MYKSTISTVCPVYNGGRESNFIHRQTNSILNQTYQKFELLLVDDGSQDDSGDVCDYYAYIDERVITIHKKNGGEASSRNIGIKLSSGEYLHVVDQDDYVDNEMYYDMVQYLPSSPDIIKGGYRINEREIKNSHPTEVMLNRQYIISEIIPFTIETSIDEAKKFSGHWSMISKLSLIKEKGLYYDESLPKMNDSKFMVDILAVANTLIFLDKGYYKWIRRSGSLTSHYSNMFSGITRACDYYATLFSGDEYDYDFYSQDKLKHNVRFTFDSLELVLVHWRTINVLKEMELIFSDRHCRLWFDKLKPYDALTTRMKYYIRNKKYKLATVDYITYFLVSHTESKIKKIANIKGKRIYG